MTPGLLRSTTSGLGAAVAKLYLPIDVRDDYAIRVRWILDGVSLGMRLRWHPRCSGWYYAIEDSDGVTRAQGRRLEPGADLIPDRTWPTLPPGELRAEGAVDLTRREYLGTAVQLIYLTAEDSG